MALTPEQIADEVRRARADGAFWRVDEGVVAARGPDAATFLHNVFTADIKGLAPLASATTLQCDARGRALRMLSVLRLSEQDFALLVPTPESAALLESLAQVHFSEDLRLSDESALHAVYVVCGSQARPLLAAVGEEGTASRIADLKPRMACALRLAGVACTVIREGGGGDARYRLLLNSARAAELERALMEMKARFGVFTPAQATREVLRIEAGEARLGPDLPVQNLASELGIDHEVFHYNKGCYIGQEIIARIHTKGVTPWRVMGLVFAEKSATPQGGEHIQVEGKPAAVIGSAVFSPTLGRVIAIARVAKEYQRQGAELSHAGAKVEVVELPFVLPEVLERPRSELYERALSLFAQDQEHEALSLLELRLADAPHDLDAWEALGVIHDRQGRRDAAIAAMQKIVEADPHHLMANVNLSLYYMKIGDKATAEAYQSKATRISMERRMAEQRGRGGPGENEAERVAKLEARLDKFKAIIDMEPSDVLGHFGAGKACLDLKRFREAAGHFEAVIAIQADYSVAWANLGTAYAALGEVDKAREVWNKGIEVARKKGDMMPVRDMEFRLERLPKVGAQ